MIVPLHMKLANSMLVGSKWTHDIAVDALVSYSHIDIPHSIEPFSDNIMEHLVMFGDFIGHVMLSLYIILLKMHF